MICEAHHVLGHTEETQLIVPIDFSSYMNEIQKVASAVTYGKRYAFCDAFGIMTGDEDDDSIIAGEVEQKEIKKESYEDIGKKVGNAAKIFNSWDKKQEILKKSFELKAYLDDNELNYKNNDI